MRKKVISLFCAILLMPVASAQTDLSENGAANSYVVSECGKYSFKAVKGNGECPVGDVFSCEVLWESFGTSESPVPGELIYDVSCDKDYVYMTVPEPFRRGNAVIAAKDKSGNILWSWHIWLTDKPDGLELVNGDVIMDRNIGAVSTDASSAESYGLLYQWGRKDPFPGTCVKHDKTAIFTFNNSRVFASAIPFCFKKIIIIRIKNRFFSACKVKPIFADGNANARCTKMGAGGIFGTIKKINLVIFNYSGWVKYVFFFPVNFSLLHRTKEGGVLLRTQYRIHFVYFFKWT